MIGVESCNAKATREFNEQHLQQIETSAVVFIKTALANAPMIGGVVQISTFNTLLFISTNLTIAQEFRRTHSTGLKDDIGNVHFFQYRQHKRPKLITFLSNSQQISVVHLVNTNIPKVTEHCSPKKVLKQVSICRGQHNSPLRRTRPLHFLLKQLSESDNFFF